MFQPAVAPNDERRRPRSDRLAREPPNHVRDLFAPAPTDRDTGAIAQNHRALASRFASELANAIEVHDRRAVRANESSAVETRLEGGKRFADQMPATTRVNRRIVVVRLDPVDLALLENQLA